MAMLLRENSRRMNSQIIFSNDEGATWTRLLPNSLTGDRHQAIYTPDGRLLLSFRDTAAAYWRYQALQAAYQDCDRAQLKAQAGPASPWVTGYCPSSKSVGKVILWSPCIRKLPFCTCTV